MFHKLFINSKNRLFLKTELKTWNSSLIFLHLFPPAWPPAWSSLLPLHPSLRLPLSQSERRGRRRWRRSWDEEGSRGGEWRRNQKRGSSRRWRRWAERPCRSGFHSGPGGVPPGSNCGDQRGAPRRQHPHPHRQQAGGGSHHPQLTPAGEGHSSDWRRRSSAPANHRRGWVPVIIWSSQCNPCGGQQLGH